MTLREMVRSGQITAEHLGQLAKHEAAIKSVVRPGRELVKDAIAEHLATRARPDEPVVLEGRASDGRRLRITVEVLP